MRALLVLIFFAFVAVAAAFVVWPVLRRRADGRRRLVLAAAAAVLVLGVGGGVYVMLGSPGLALRTLTGPGPTDLPALVAKLVERVRADPNDLKAWTLLGRGYLTLGDPGDAAAAFRQAVPLAPPPQRPEILADYGEALTLANSGHVPRAAEKAFAAALKADPKNAPARYYLGLAYAGRRQTAKALAIWQSLLDDAPPGASWRAMLVDRIAALKAGSLAAGAGQAPDIGAMVARLATRLKAHPNDPTGWQRLIRAYSVLGEQEKARTALAQARIALRDNPTALAALEGEAKTLDLGRK
jgi:cytochrome c-type biogenesis protein CcmH